MEAEEKAQANDAIARMKALEKLMKEENEVEEEKKEKPDENTVVDVKAIVSDESETPPQTPSEAKKEKIAKMREDQEEK